MSHDDAVLVFASLAVLLLYKGYDRFVEPHAAAARARRNKHSMELTRLSTDKVQFLCCNHSALRVSMMS